MVNFVGLLKRTIDAQSNATPVLRRLIYDRTRETVEKQMAEKNIAPDLKALQYRILEKAIHDVESHYLQFDNPSALPSSLQKAEDSFVASLHENTAIKAAAPIQSSSPYSDHFASAPTAYPSPSAQKQTNERGYFARNFTEFPAVHNDPYTDNFTGEHETLAPTASRENGSQDNRYGRGLFRFEEDKETSKLTPDEQRERPKASYPSYEAASQATNLNIITDNKVFAGHNPDEPLPSLIDFGRSFSQRPNQNASANVSGQSREPYYDNSGMETNAGRLYEESYAASPDFDNYDALKDSTAELPVNDPSLPLSSYQPSSPEEHRSDFSRTAEILRSRDSFSPIERGHNSEGPMPYADDFADLHHALFSQEEKVQNEGQNSSADMAPLPDFLSTIEDSAPYDTDTLPEEGTAFNLEQALAAQDKTSDNIDQKVKQQEQPLPEELHNVHYEPDGDILLPELKTTSSAVTSNTEEHIASGIFAQAAIREKRRSYRRRLITGGAIIVTVLAIFAGIFWFLTDFLNNDKHKIAALIGKNPATHEEVEKANQRLTADGREVETAPQPQTKTAAPTTQTTEQIAPTEQTVQNTIEANTASPDLQQTGAVGEVLFRETQTALMPATAAKGAIRWSLLHEKSPDGIEDTVLRGELNIPDRDLVMRMTIRPNHDKGIPAVYLVELMFIVPENFEGMAIDKISPLMFKATEQSTNQELLDTHVYKINDNFFVVTLNSPQEGLDPRLQHNIALIEQLPWLSLNVAYKNGRIGEFTFAKGPEGDALFKQFFDSRSDAANKSDGKNKAQTEIKSPAQ